MNISQLKLNVTAFLQIANFLLPTFSFAQPGTLDTTFGIGGLDTMHFEGSDKAYSVALQNDGKIVVAGYSNSSFALMRLNIDGSLDTLFGSGGIVITSFDGSYAVGHAVAIQSDQKIVLAGGSFGDFTLARYNNDGSLDTSFSTDGIVTTDFGGTPDLPYSVAIQPDGKIVAGGYSGDWTDENFAMARYNVDGSLDNTFSTDGILITAIGLYSDDGYSVAIQSDGKILLAGFSSGDFALVRYKSDGSLDNTFSVDGKLITDFGGASDRCNSVAIQSDGKIVVGGDMGDLIDQNFALVRYNIDGSLDNTFGSDGKVITSVGDFNDRGYSLAIQEDGKILLAGNTYNDSTYDFAIVRYNSDGSLDNSFGTGGITITNIGSVEYYKQSIAIQQDNKIVLAGFTYSDFQSDITLVRYNGDSIAVGVNEINARTAIAVFPNPFKNELSIHIGCRETNILMGKIVLFDMIGNEIVRQNIRSSEIKINTQHLLPGFYLLQYSDGMNTENFKVVKN